MTFRAKPVVKRAHRPAWEAQDRRNFYLNLGFGLIVVLAIVILGIAIALTYYNDHLASVGSVDGQSITKDDLKDRMLIEQWRLDEGDRRIDTAVLAGHLSDAQGAAQKQVIEQQRTQLSAIALERIIDSRVQAKLATQEGIGAVTPEEIDARLKVEATIPESRHAWILEVKPVVELGGVEPSAAAKAEAKSKADAALADIKGGKSWDDVAKTVSTDASTAPQAGDLGWILAEGGNLDEAFEKAVFATPANEPTAVVEGSDGIFRIGRTTEMVPSVVDDAYPTKIQNDKIDLQKYRAVVTADVIHQKLQDKVTAGVTGPAPQRKVSEIYIAEAPPELGTDAVKTRHILYSPNGDPGQASTIDAADPAWEAAKQKALSAYVRLKEKPEQFDAVARAESDESSAKGPTGTGGKLPYFDSKSQVDAAFLAAVKDPNLKPGDIVGPVKSAFGWHIIQVMYRPTDVAHLTELKAKADNGGDFALLARDTSEAPSASVGGDVGWGVRGQYDDRLANAIFGAPIGKTSEIVAIPEDGTYLFKVFAEETRTPEGRQLKELESTTFSKWYDAKKQAVTITRDETISSS